MGYNQQLPEWNKTASKPTQTKLDNGWEVQEKPPASVFNWLSNTTYLALQELQQYAIHSEQKGAVNGVASLGADSKIPTAQIPSLSYVPTTTYTANDVLAKIKTVDGVGSGLDTDFFNGVGLSDFFVKRGSLETNADFNNIVTPGVYHVGDTVSMLNTPPLSSAAWSVLEVSATSSGYIVQRFTQVVSTNKTFYRVRNEQLNGWTAWKGVGTMFEDKTPKMSYAEAATATDNTYVKINSVNGPGIVTGVNVVDVSTADTTIKIRILIDGVEVVKDVPLVLLQTGSSGYGAGAGGISLMHKFNTSFEVQALATKLSPVTIGAMINYLI